MRHNSRLVLAKQGGRKSGKSKSYPRSASYLGTSGKIITGPSHSSSPKSRPRHRDSRPSARRKVHRMDVDGPEYAARNDAEGPSTSSSSTDTGPILFYDRDQPFYEFTNFSPHSVRYQGDEYPTAEHCFQASKFLTKRRDIADRIRMMHSPRDALQEATRVARLRRPDWFEVNVSIMDDILEAKFTQHEDLRELLLSTEDREIVEASPIDAFWGYGADKEGRNELGKALVRLRAKLRANPDLGRDRHDTRSRGYERESEHKHEDQGEHGHGDQHGQGHENRHSREQESEREREHEHEHEHVPSKRKLKEEAPAAQARKPSYSDVAAGPGRSSREGHDSDRERERERDRAREQKKQVSGRSRASDAARADQEDRDRQVSNENSSVTSISVEIIASSTSRRTRS